MDDLLLRRRIMMAGGVEPWVPTGDISEYISSGLSFHVDGIECYNGNVKDLVTNTTLTEINSSHIHYLEKGVYLDGGGALYVASTLLPNSSAQTIEVCFRIRVVQDCCLFTSGVNASNSYYPNVVITRAGDKITFLARKGAAYNPGVVTDGKYTISMTTTRGIKNGVAMSTNGTTYYANQYGYTIIGARRYSNKISAYFNGDVYSIRVYSRQLTEAEMRHNQKVDNVRFGLGYTI